MDPDALNPEHLISVESPPVQKADTLSAKSKNIDVGRLCSPTILRLLEIF